MDDLISTVKAGSESPAALNNLDGPVLPTWRLICIILSVCFGLFLSLLDTTIVATALYTIGIDLNSLQSINWVALAYTLSYLSCAVLFSRLADVVGRRNSFAAAFIIFFVFSLACGFAQTFNQLIAFRVLQGIGGSGLYSITFVILPEICPPKIAQAIGGIAGAVVAMSGVLGPVLGGIITHYTTWRWIFWINAPIGIGPLVLFTIAWPKPSQIRFVKHRSFKELDLIGATIIVAASILVVFPFQEAGMKTDAWKTPVFIVPLVVGILCYGMLVGWEIFVAKYRKASLMTMFPQRLMGKRIYMAYVASTLLAGYTYFSVIYSLPLRLQIVNGKSPLLAGISLLPMLGSSALASTISGAINAKRDKICLTLFIGSISLVIGTACLTTLSDVVQVESKMYGCIVFVGLGFGLMVSTVSLGAVMESEMRDATVAQGVIAQARVLGGSLGIAASTALLGATERRELSDLVTSEQLANLQSSARTMTESQLRAVRQAYSDSFSDGMRVCAAVSGLCVFVTLLAYRKIPMDFRKRREEQIREAMEDKQSTMDTDILKKQGEAGPV